MLQTCLKKFQSNPILVRSLWPCCEKIDTISVQHYYGDHVLNPIILQIRIIFYQLLVDSHEKYVGLTEIAYILSKLYH